MPDDNDFLREAWSIGKWVIAVAVIFLSAGMINGVCELSNTRGWHILMFVIGLVLGVIGFAFAFRSDKYIGAPGNTRDHLLNAAIVLLIWAFCFIVYSQHVFGA